ncbi:MAG: DUF3320 domain-containing protein [Ruminococcus sp.]|nr:DUF3320 domain-containing protein [Ruminococcus sp.]
MNASTNSLKITADITPVINYALYQNHIPVMRSVVIDNPSDSACERVTLTVTASPDIILPYSLVIDYLPAHNAYSIRDIELKLNADDLANRTEKVSGTLTVALSGETGVLASQTLEISVTAFDEWQGSGVYPELLTAFVTPNHPALANIIAKASEYLGKWTGDPSFDGYQSQDVNRVLSQSAAIFEALREQQTIYCTAPASFEESGQRVRLSDAVLTQKMGNCLDLTLLYASCLEAVGLHPLLLLRQGHIFAGVWLEDLSFPEAVQYDASVVSKRLALGVNEIAVAESTLVVSGKHASFDEARANAEKQLHEGIECIIDVYRARISGILPLPQRVRTDTGFVVQKQVSRTHASVQPQAIEKFISETPGQTEERLTKQMQWERKLLDLGLRNNLINLRFSKTLVPILTSSLDDLEDALSDGEDFTILSKPAEWGGKKDADFETMHELGGYADLIKSEFANHRLRSVLTEAELEAGVKNLYRGAKASLEENGANTLYIAMGLLRWYETERSVKPRYAPIILLPIEIIRKSARQGYVLRLRDDDPQMNITMLEKLKQDFGIVINGLDPLPEDEHGIDTRRVFTVIRKAVMNRNKWDVLESAYLGIFSFTQFVMWNDIRNRSDDLQKNKIVKSLMEGRLCWNAEPMTIGDRVEEGKMMLPMPADASQLFAIEAACEGKSFVLHGPPGTGKSQTITSLIANLLISGKSVLFVAEKMAALEVVQKRLNKIGIGAFCLELHSNKSKKRDVLEQLREATEVTKKTSSAQYRVKAEQAAKLRAELAAYADVLHQIQPCGQSLYQLIGTYETVDYEGETAAFSRDYVEKLDSAALENQQTLLERLVASGRTVGHPYQHPLAPIGMTQYSQQNKAALDNSLEEYYTALNHIRPSLEAAAEMAQTEVITFEDISKIHDFSIALCYWLSLPPQWSQAADKRRYFSDVMSMAKHYQNLGYLHAELSRSWNEGFLNQNPHQLTAEYNAANAKWIGKSGAIRQITDRLKPFARVPINSMTLPQSFQTLANYQSEFREAQALYRAYGSELGYLAEGGYIDWNRVGAMANQALNNLPALSVLIPDEVRRAQLLADVSAKADLDAFIKQYEALNHARQAFVSAAALRDTPTEGSWIDAQLDMCENLRGHWDALKDWVVFNSVAEETRQAGLGDVLNLYQAGLPHEELLPLYRKSLLYALISLIIDENPALNTFSGSVFNEKIAQLKRIEGELTELCKQEIFCRLAANVPDFTSSAANSSELGILQRMIRSGGRGTSIRKLFDDLPNLLPRLCPCMLMSPISAAQYLSTNRKPFDVVVFDEASQLPTCKAVGVLARGENAVIVGDPKQMPPTSFFAANTVDEDNLDIEDLESILDDCLALNMPQTHLLWHYRSRHESLIAFSNSQFYENKLYTFPSVNDRESKVNLVHVDGVFERGSNRRNRKEAEAVIEEIKRRYQDSALSKQSLGVVTFNISQQNLIDDLLSEACAADEGLEKWLYEAEEPIFIKNLENVQGDERDVILFSVGYGPDQDGKVYMNFGPLNREGGWRRLNVAVSRARSEMLVFSSITPEQINLTKTGAEGVASLRAFLEYASGRELALTRATSGQLRADQNGVAAEICDRLHEAGYETVQNVGHSAFRIDIGVVNSSDKEKYLLGILLDGETYGSSKTVRDREYAQIGVLNGLGWQLTRVWTMDWWDNREKELERLLALLKKLENGEVIEDDAVKPVSAGSNLLESNGTEPQAFQPVQPYRAAAIKNRAVSAENLPRHLDKVAHTVSEIMRIEAPISRNMLTKRVLSSYSITRSTAKTQELLSDIYRRLRLQEIQQDDEDIFWNQGQDPSAYPFIRVCGEGDCKRDVRDVPRCEAMNAVMYVLRQQISLAEQDAVKEAAKLMGYPRMSSNVSAVFQAAFDAVRRANLSEQDANGNWKMK